MYSGRTVLFPCDATSIADLRYSQPLIPVSRETLVLKISGKSAGRAVAVALRPSNDTDTQINARNLSYEICELTTYTYTERHA